VPPSPFAAQVIGGGIGRSPFKTCTNRISGHVNWNGESFPKRMMTGLVANNSKSGTRAGQPLAHWTGQASAPAMKNAMHHQKKHMTGAEMYKLSHSRQDVS